MNVPVTVCGSELGVLSSIGPQTDIVGVAEATFAKALCVLKEVIPNAFGIVFRLEKADCAGCAGGCEGSSAVLGLKKADSVGLGPKVSVSH